MTIKSPTKAQKTSMELLESSPGGITVSDIIGIISNHGLNHVDSFMVTISAWSPFWEELDEDGERWYHSIKYNYLYPDSVSDLPKKRQRAKKIPAKKRANLENPGDYAWIKIDRQTLTMVKTVAADAGNTMLDWLTVAIDAKLAKGQPEKSPECTWKFTTLAGVRLPRDLVRRVKKAIIGTDLTIGEFCREAAKERMG